MRRSSRYLEFFDSSQFHIALFQSIVSPEPFEVHHGPTLWRQLGLDVPQNYTVNLAPVNDNTHPSLKEDLSPHTMEVAKAYVKSKMMEPLVHLLVTHPDFHLYGQPARDNETLSYWLAAKWG